MRALSTAGDTHSVVWAHTLSHIRTRMGEWVGSHPELLAEALAVVAAAGAQVGENTGDSRAVCAWSCMLRSRCKVRYWRYQGTTYCNARAFRWGVGKKGCVCVLGLLERGAPSWHAIDATPGHLDAT